MQRLLHSAKFWSAVVAGVFNIATFVVAHYFPTVKELVAVIIVSLDGVFAVVIASYAYEDGKAKAFQGQAKPLPDMQTLEGDPEPMIYDQPK